MWHHATYRGEELLVLGHNPRNNDCMLVKLSGLPMNEQSELRKIASARSSQESNYMIPVLQHQTAPNGQDWFSYLCKKMEQRNSPVFILPIKEIQDSLDGDQKAIFKGYGKGRTNKTLEVEDRSRDYTGREDERFNGPDLDVVKQAAPSAMEQKIDALTASTQQTNAVLNKLVDVLLADKQPPLVVKKSSSKVRRTRKPDTTEAVLQEHLG